jgi:two-component system phosphate regulon sensor histidine kinase PhoR
MLKKLNTLMIAVLVMAVLATGLASFQTFSRYNDENNRQYLISAGLTIHQQITGGQEPAAAVSQTLEAFNHDKVTLRVTIVNRQGLVLYDNEADSSQMDNHLFRAEIALAFKNEGTGYAVRRSDTVKTEMIYMAQYEPSLDIVVRTAMPVYHSKATLRELFWTIALVMAIALAILILVSALMTRWITRPLQNLKTAASAMADGQYDVRIHQLAQDDNEVSMLGTSFNRMAEQLQKTIHDLQDRSERLDIIFNTMTDPMLVTGEFCAVTFMNRKAREIFGRDLNPDMAVYPLMFITHSKESEALVDQAVREKRSIQAELNLKTVTGMATFLVIVSPIQTADSTGAILTLHDVTETKRLQKMRTDFVANVTHELKTPLTSIRGFVETLRAGAIRKPEVADRFLEFIDIEAERLHQLIRDILILSEIEEVKHESDLQKFDLNALIDDVAVLLDDAATQAQVSIRVDESSEPLMVAANPNRIKQILINLVDNAVKYNNPGGNVNIQAGRMQDGMVRITVQDNGVGIDREHQDRLFERFYRVDASRSREKGGTGLGLSIVKHIAQLYGGYAKVDSKPGEGAAFSVYLKI